MATKLSATFWNSYLSSDYACTLSVASSISQLLGFLSLRLGAKITASGTKLTKFFSLPTLFFTYSRQNPLYKHEHPFICTQMLANLSAMTWATYIAYAMTSQCICKMFVYGLHFATMDAASSNWLKKTLEAQTLDPQKSSLNIVRKNNIFGPRTLLISTTTFQCFINKPIFGMPLPHLTAVTVDIAYQHFSTRHRHANKSWRPFIRFLIFFY